MRVEEHVAALRREGELMVSAVAGYAKAGSAASDAAQRPSHGTGWDTAVPTCPGWTVRELAHHLGRVHRWAAHIVSTARATPPDEETEGDAIWGTMPGDGETVEWLRDGHARLVDTLERADAGLACWTFLPAPTPLAFWARRQAHETAVHRADAQAATGGIDAVDPAFGADGIDELLMGFYSRPRNRARSDVARALAVTAEDAGAGWIIHFGPDGARPVRGAGPAEADVRGPASDLYFALWNRLPLTSLRPTGDVSLLDLWHENAKVRWA